MYKEVSSFLRFNPIDNAQHSCLQASISDGPALSAALQFAENDQKPAAGYRVPEIYLFFGKSW
jgi:hypothetical protein